MKQYKVSVSLTHGKPLARYFELGYAMQHVPGYARFPKNIGRFVVSD
jgi:hypothetical protein